MNISEILKNNPELAGSIMFINSASDLHEFANYCIEAGRRERPATKEPDKLLTPKQFADELGISLVTLWSYDKKNITHPVRIGSQKRYRRSDLEKILRNA